MDKAKLFVLSGSQVGEEVEVGDSLIIGRSTKAGLSLKDSTVSREHARLLSRDGRWLLVDLKSSNGTKVQGRPTTKAELNGGEEIMVGDVRLRFQLQGAAGIAPETGDAQAPAELEAPAPAPASAPAAEKDDLEIEWDDDPTPSARPEPPRPAAARPTPARPAPAPSPVPRPAAPTAPGAPQMRRLGGAGTPGAPAPATAAKERSGVIHEDMGQWGGVLKILVYVLLLGLFGGLFYICFTLAAGS